MKNVIEIKTKSTRNILEIKDVDNIIWNFPKFIRKIFVKTYYNQGLVHIEKNPICDRPTHVSNTVKWLDEVKVETTSSKIANRLTWEYLNVKYPQYKGFIQLF